MKVTIDTSEVPKCAFKDCNRKHLARHHKGCDHYLGFFNIQIAKDYDKFLDCVLICDWHHMVIHYMYGPLIKRWHNRTAQGALIFRAELIKFCDKILAGTIKLKKPSKKHKRIWRQKRATWLKARAPKKS